MSFLQYFLEDWNNPRKLETLSSNTCEIHVIPKEKIVFLPITKSKLDPGAIPSENHGC